MYNNNSTFMELRVTGEPETIITSNGSEVCKVNAAMFQGKRSDGKDPIWITIEAWKYPAKCLATLEKGDVVLIDGSLKQDSWDDKDGNTRTRLIISANTIAKKVWAPKEQAPGYTKTTNNQQQQNVQPGQPVQQKGFDQGLNQQSSDEIPF